MGTKKSQTYVLDEGAKLTFHKKLRVDFAAGSSKSPLMPHETDSLISRLLLEAGAIMADA